MIRERRLTRLRPRNRKPLLTAICASALVMAACGTPTADPEPESAAADESDSGTDDSGDAAGGELTLEDVYAELEGLEGEQRDARLLELAQAESGEFNVYLTTNEQESGPWLESFTEMTGIDVLHYRASETELVQRVEQEWRADFHEGADVVATGTTALYQMDQAFAPFSPLKTPYADQMIPEAVRDNMIAYTSNAMLVMWNTNNISPEEAPSTWEEALTNYSDRLVLEGRDWKWMGTLIPDYFMAELGWTEQEAVDLFKSAAQGAAVARGHTFINGLVISGEYDIAVSSFINRTEADIADGAPIAWKPAVEPLVVQPNGAAIHKYARRPATALLFIEHLMTNIQESLPESSYIPMNTTISGSPAEGLSLIFMDPERLENEQDKWISLYEEVIQQTSVEVEE